MPVVSVPSATELALIVAVSVALPKFVSVAEPDKSPPNVIVGSEVAVVAITHDLDARLAIHCGLLGPVELGLANV